MDIQFKAITDGLKLTEMIQLQEMGCSFWRKANTTGYELKLPEKW
jgi:hypothetical protein